MGPPPRSAPLLLWPQALFGGTLRQSAWLCAFLGAHLFWHYQPHHALGDGTPWSVAEWISRSLLLILGLAIAFAGVGRGIVAMGVLRLGVGVVGELCDVRRFGAFAHWGLFRLRYSFALDDETGRVATRWWLGSIDAAPARRTLLLARPDPPQAVMAVTDLPEAVTAIERGVVRAQRLWLGLLSILLPGLVIVQNRVFLLRSDSPPAKILIAIMLLVFGLLPALLVIAAAISRVREKRGEPASQEESR